MDEHTRFVLDATETGFWEWDLDTEMLLWDETCEQLFGYETGSFPGTYDAFIDRILRSDRSAVDERITTAIETGGRYDLDFRIERPDGERRWVRSRGFVEEDDSGTPTRLVGTQTDVTEERERQRELESYRKLFESTTDCVVEIERVGGDSLIRRVNSAFETVFGYSEAEVRDEDIHDVLTPEEYRDRAMEIRQEYLAGNQPVVEVTRNTADGQREFLMRAVNFQDRFYVVYTDITERKEREQALEKARAELRQVIDLIPDPLFAKTRDDEVLLSNEANAELHGMTPDEIEGKREHEIESDVENIDNFDKYRQREIEVMETGRAATFEEELTDPDGETHVFQTTRIPFEATGTDKEAVLGYARDVTDRKAYEQELEKLNTRLQLALEETNTGVWEWDLDTDEVVWDETSERLFGYDAGEFPGEFSGFADRVPEEDLQRVRAQVDHAIETGEQYRADFRVQPPMADQRWVQARGVVEHDADGEPERLLGVQTDITERKERERQLQRQNERLDQFAGAVSHDLRNPLMVALARLDIIRDAAPDEHVETMERNLERMEEMIEDLLTLARIDQHTSKFEQVVLPGTVRDAWDHADVADCEFELSIPETAKLEADRNRLLHIFENLFRNAADHNDTPVTVRVGMLSDSDSDIDGGQRTGFFVEDNGTGIPDEQRGDIFDRGHTTSAEGTGFGLSIVRDIVKEHGWDIRVTDGTDGGARFEITGVDIDR